MIFYIILKDKAGYIPLFLLTLCPWLLHSHPIILHQLLEIQYDTRPRRRGRSYYTVLELKEAQKSCSNLSLLIHMCS